jgi:hypothetical protein
VRTNLRGDHSRPSLPSINLSTAEILLELSRNLVEANNFLGELDVVTEVTRPAEVGQNADDVLLLAQESILELPASLQELLLGRRLGDFLALLAAVISGRLAFAGGSLAARCGLLLSRR